MIYFAAVGMTIIVTQSGLFEGIRLYIEKRSSFFGELFSCPMCFGFWAGVFISAYCYAFYNMSLDPFIMGCSSSILSFLTFKVMNLISSISEAARSFCFEPEDDIYEEEIK